MREGNLVADGSQTEIAAGAHGAWARSFLQAGLG